MTKQIKGSFISEHMLIKTQYMREMLDEIENNSQLHGENYQQKIMNAMDTESMTAPGFSEFETYGTYVTARHPEAYALRKWRSLRTFKKYYSDVSQIDEQNEKWLAKYYDAVSIEKWQHDTRLSGVIRSRLFKKIFPPQILELFHKIEMLGIVLKSL